MIEKTQWSIIPSVISQSESFVPFLFYLGFAVVTCQWSACFRPRLPIMDSKLDPCRNFGKKGRSSSVTPMTSGWTSADEVSALGAFKPSSKLHWTGINKPWVSSESFERTIGDDSLSQRNQLKRGWQVKPQQKCPALEGPVFHPSNLATWHHRTKLSGCTRRISLLALKFSTNNISNIMIIKSTAWIGNDLRAFGSLH